MRYSSKKRSDKIASILILLAAVWFASACSSSTNQSVAGNRTVTGNQSAAVNEQLEGTNRNSPANSVFNQTDNNGQPASQVGLKPPTLPDAKLTPGDTLDVTKDDICVSGYSKKVRDVPQTVKEQAYKEYGITQREPGEYEIDHLISLELGGSNSIKNLWAESYRTAPWNARVKDKLENKLHEMICSGQIDLKVAQQAIASNWIDAYKKYIGDQPGSEAVNKGNLARNQPASSKESNTNRQSKANPNSSNTANYPLPTSGAIIGNKNSHAYHLPGCSDYDKISPKNRVEFQSAKDAEAAGYHLAGNCRQR